MADNDLALQAKLRKLTLGYAKDLPAKISEIGNLWIALKTDWSRDQAEIFYRQVHSLSGSSGSYGATELHLQSRELEKIIVTVKENDRVPASSIIKDIDLALGITANIAGTWAEEFEYANRLVSGNDLDGPDSVDSTDEKESSRQAEYRLLYIEDNPANLNLVKQLVRSRWPSADLLTAEDPVSGLKLLEEFKFKLVLLDINLPIMSGYDVLARIRENYTTAKLPVIAVSALAMSEDVHAGYEAGFNEYITKPIEIENFFAVVNKYLT